MMISDLPTEILEEIFNRLPATSMLRSRATCKQWNTLLRKNQRLVEAAKQPLVLMLTDFRVFPVSLSLDVAYPSIVFKSPPLSLKDSYSNSKQVDIITVFYCDGLLLCTTKDDRLVVWNPYLGETRWIPLKTHYKRDTMFALGYQNNNKSCSSSYRILRCWNRKEPISYVEFEIYEFSSDSWRVLDYIALDCIILQNIGVSLNGNTYWLASDDQETYFLLRFDFTRLRSKCLYFPPIQSFGRRNKMILSVVRDQQLAVLCQERYKLKMEIWITNNIDTEGGEAVLIWSKLYIMDIPIVGSYFPPFVSYLIDEEKTMIVCWDVSGKKVTIIGENSLYIRAMPYEESKSSWLLYTLRNLHCYSPSLVQI